MGGQPSGICRENWILAMEAQDDRDLACPWRDGAKEHGVVNRLGA